MKKRKDRDLEDIEMDMTPMIDVVFNLIIFFMLVTQMVTLERAELELPVATEAKEEKGQDKNKLVINIHKDGRIEVRTEILTWAELAKELFQTAQEAKGPDGFSTKAILIRGDTQTAYKNIQRVMIECAKQKIYKVSFGAKIISK